ncbi:hypothetical protein JCM6292_948 [Bacteroides pyogenes JCM 6292]|uniref:Uncharacterized protein n=2 Tax=Bacteroides pyogenes TaxID=310300 RepID=W4P4N7_9BACE|nr:hypothetical protein JCM6292_948 [Bacteroides pyogenes JCM 6292]
MPFRPDIKYLKMMVLKHTHTLLCLCRAVTCQFAKPVHSLQKIFLNTNVFKAGGEELFKIEAKSNLMYCHRIAWKTKGSFK